MRFLALTFCVSFLASLLACDSSQSSEGTAPTGIYEVHVETVGDDCDAPLSTEGSSEQPVHMSEQAISFPYPGNPPPSSGWSVTYAVRDESLPRSHEILGCPGGVNTHEVELTDETSDFLEIDLALSWTGVEGCARPGLPARDCRSERTLTYDLVEACDLPCQIVSDCGPDGCDLGDLGWHCECGGEGPI